MPLAYTVRIRQAHGPTPLRVTKDTGDIITRRLPMELQAGKLPNLQPMKELCTNGVEL